MKTTLKRTLAMIMSLSMLSSIAVINASAEEITDGLKSSYESEVKYPESKTKYIDYNYTYEIDGDTLKIDGTGNVGKSGSLSKESYPWNEQREKITKVVIGSSITSICEYAFADMPNLSEVVFENLENDNDLYIRYAAFKGDYNLHNITLGENFSFDFLAFEKDADLTIKGYEYSKVHYECLDQCINFESVGSAEKPYFASSGVIDGNASNGIWKFDFSTNTLYVNSDEDAIAPESKIIGYKEEMSSIDYVTGEIRYISVPIWDNHYYIDTVGEDVKEPPMSIIHNVVFDGKMKEISNVLSMSDFVTSVELPDSLETLGKFAFALKNLEYVKLPESLKTIDSNAFAFCYNLKKVYIPSSVESINGTAFNKCPETFEIYGHKGTVAEKFANENNIKFVDVDENGMFENTSVSGDLNNDGKFDIYDVLRDNYSVNDDYKFKEQFPEDDYTEYKEMRANLLSGNGKTVTTENLTEPTQPSESSEPSSETAEETKAESLKFGDINLDGDVTIADAILLNKYLVGSVTLSEAAQKNADCDKDGKLTSSDTLVILDYVVGSIDEIK